MRLVRLGALVTCAALVALAVVGCSNPSGGSDPTSSTHSWYYTVSVSTGSTVDVIYCINSSGGQDSPGNSHHPLDLADLLRHDLQFHAARGHSPRIVTERGRRHHHRYDL